jgi:hypothetical protein
MSSRTSPRINFRFFLNGLGGISSIKYGLILLRLMNNMLFQLVDIVVLRYSGNKETLHREWQFSVLSSLVRKAEYQM